MSRESRPTSAVSHLPRPASLPPRGTRPARDDRDRRPTEGEAASPRVEGAPSTAAYQIRSPLPSASPHHRARGPGGGKEAPPASPQQNVSAAAAAPRRSTCYAQLLDEYIVKVPPSAPGSATKAKGTPQRQRWH